MVSFDGRLGLLLKKKMSSQPADTERTSRHGGSSSVSTTLKDEEPELVQMPGFRFHPTEEELVGYYLAHMVSDGHHRKRILRVIRLINFYQYDPWELPAMAAVGETEWYFFCPRVRKYQKGCRANRLTFSGYWKATGVERQVKSSSDSSTTIGVKKTLVFYGGRAPNGTKSNWIMNEYRLVSASSGSSSASSSSAGASSEPFDQTHARHGHANSSKVAMVLTCNPRNAYHGDAKASQRNSAFLHQSEVTLCRVYKKPGTPGSHQQQPAAEVPISIVPPPILKMTQEGWDSTTGSLCYQQPQQLPNRSTLLDDIDVNSSRPRQLSRRMNELPSELACLLGEIAARATTLQDQQHNSNAALASDSGLGLIERSSSCYGKNGYESTFGNAPRPLLPPAAETVHPSSPSEPWVHSIMSSTTSSKSKFKGPPSIPRAPPRLDLSSLQEENVMTKLPASTSDLYPWPAAILSWLFEDSQ